MQTASTGMTDMKGEVAVDPLSQLSQQEEFSYSNETIAEKQEKLQRMKSYNIFSSVGKVLANTVSSVVEGLIHFFSSFL